MTRLTYFSIECDEPSPNWVLSLQGTHIPFHLLGLSGIILSPAVGKARFDSLEEIEQTFSIIEKNSSLYVDVNDLWLPNFLLYFAKKRGYVYRVTRKLFLLAVHFRENRISKEDFSRSCVEMKRMIRCSLLESKAFREWSKFQVDEAKGLYPKSERHALKWI
jgi:hypothetical protein